jgi:hypothetical protein
VVSVGDTSLLPVRDTLPIPWSIETELALVTFHIKAAEAPELITAGLTSKFITIGAGLTVIIIDLDVVPARLLADSVYTVVVVGNTV